MFMLVSWFGLTLPLLNAADWFQIGRAVQQECRDRKSGSAGMPRPISYAVFCLKKKKKRTIVKKKKKEKLLRTKNTGRQQQRNRSMRQKVEDRVVERARHRSHMVS